MASTAKKFAKLQKAAKAKKRAAKPVAKKRARRKNAESPRATYKRTHWGEEGKGEARRMKAPDPKHSAVVMLGVLRRVEYETDKGEGKQIFFHDFGKGRSERGRADAKRCPVLAFNRDGLLIVGGEYLVKTEGIVG